MKKHFYLYCQTPDKRKSVPKYQCHKSNFSTYTTCNSFFFCTFAGSLPHTPEKSSQHDKGKNH